MKRIVNFIFLLQIAIRITGLSEVSRKSSLWQNIKPSKLKDFLKPPKKTKSIVNRNLQSNNLANHDESTQSERKLRRRRRNKHRRRQSKNTNRRIPVPTFQPCDLSVRVYPLMFFALTQNIEFRVAFRSSCIRYPIMTYFTLNSTQPRSFSVADHPSFVSLSIFRNNYQFKFVEKFERGSYPDINIGYQLFRLHPSRLTVNVNAFEENRLLLHPNAHTPFTKTHIQQLNSLPGPVICNMDNTTTIMQCQIL